MGRRAPRQSERSDFYRVILEPPPPPPAILAAASAAPAKTSDQHAEQLARKKTVPAPKGRRRAPRGRRDDEIA
jgi:hypothetical protein